MEQSPAVWLIIGLSLIIANLPFIVQRHLVVLPWAETGEPSRPLLLRWLESAVFFALLYGVGWLAYDVISGTLVVYSNAMSMFAFYAKLVAYIAAVGVLMFYPGWRGRHHTIKKSAFARIVELFVLYLLIGVLAFALELNIGNRFEQTWEFYAITGSLFLVLGYPGFVFRYLMKRTRRRGGRGTAAAAKMGADTAQKA